MTIDDYFAAVGSGYTDDEAAVFGPELRRLAELGVSSREGIARFVRDEPDNPIHAELEWDDQVAGEKYRVIQVGHLLRSIKIRYRNDRGETRETRAFYPVRLSEEEEGPRQYVPIDLIYGAHLEDQIRERAWRMLRSWHAQFREIEELSDFFAPVFEAIGEVEKQTEETG